MPVCWLTWLGMDDAIVRVNQENTLARRIDLSESHSNSTPPGRGGMIKSGYIPSISHLIVFSRFQNKQHPTQHTGGLFMCVPLLLKMCNIVTHFKKLSGTVRYRVTGTALYPGFIFKWYLFAVTSFYPPRQALISDFTKWPLKLFFVETPRKMTSFFCSEKAEFKINLMLFF